MQCGKPKSSAEGNQANPHTGTHHRSITWGAYHAKWHLSIETTRNPKNNSFPEFVEKQFCRCLCLLERRSAVYSVFRPSRTLKTEHQYASKNARVTLWTPRPPKYSSKALYRGASDPPKRGQTFAASESGQSTQFPYRRIKGDTGRSAWAASSPAATVRRYAPPQPEAGLHTPEPGA